MGVPFLIYASAMPNKRDPSLPSREALYREIPDTSCTEAITGAATVDALDLASFDGESLLGRWVFLTPTGAAMYIRRYSSDDAAAPLTAAMQAGKLWPVDVTEEFYIDGNSAHTLLAVEGAGAGDLVIEFGSGA